MRKILTSVVSVAGLLAVVLALASSPAQAAKSVVTVTTATNAGTYTVSWETVGGCDPGAGTSGASGALTLTVAATNERDADPAALELTGTADVGSVTVDNDCTYKWSASFVEATVGATCFVGGLPAAGADDTPATITLTVTDAATNCGDTTKIKVTVNDGSATGTGDEAKDDDVSAGAIAETTFTVTASPVRNSNDACKAVSGETKYDSATKATSVELTAIGDAAIVKGTRRTVTCRYDVSVALPAGFAVAAADEDKAPNPADPTCATDTDCTDDELTAADVPTTVGKSTGDTETTVAEAAAWLRGNRTVEVVVATRKIFLVQTVEGDAGGAAATYKLTARNCVMGLPGELGQSQTGGIQPGTTTVELREGRFNITAAVASSASAGAEALALDNKAVACTTRVAVSNLPENCSAANPTNVVTANLRDDANSGGQVILEHVITCTESMPEPEPMPAPAPAPDDMGGDDMGSDDMSGDDMGADDMGADDMSGPKMDTPTG